MPGYRVCLRAWAAKWAGGSVVQALALRVCVVDAVSGVGCRAETKGKKAKDFRCRIHVKRGCVNGAGVEG